MFTITQLDAMMWQLIRYQAALNGKLDLTDPAGEIIAAEESIKLI